MTIDVTRNGYGIHVGADHPVTKGSLRDLTDDEARELVEKLQGALAPPPQASAWVVVSSTPGMPVSEHDPRRTGVNMIPCALDVAEKAVTAALATGSATDVRTGLLSLGEAFETAWQQRKHNPAYIVDHGDGTFTVAL